MIAVEVSFEIPVRELARPDTFVPDGGTVLLSSPYGFGVRKSVLSSWRVGD